MGTTVFQVVVGRLQSNHNPSSHESVTDEQNRPVQLLRGVGRAVIRRSAKPHSPDRARDSSPFSLSCGEVG